MANAKIPKQKVTFSYTAPAAHSVLLAGDFTGWQQAPLPFNKSRRGIWKKTVSLAPGHHEYRLLVDGQWADDPQCTRHRPNQFGSENCVCVVSRVDHAQAA